MMVGSLDVCPTASRSGNTPMSQAAAATRERSADTAKRIVNPTRTPTMGSSPRRYGRGHCSSAGGSSEGSFAVCQGYADERRRSRSVLKGAKRRAATQIWPCGIFARPTLSAIISSGDEGTVPLQYKEIWLPYRRQSRSLGGIRWPDAHWRRCSRVSGTIPALSKILPRDHRSSSSKGSGSCSSPLP